MFFITGTGTGVGKTFFSRLLVRALRSTGLDAVGMKPICCGDRDDAEALVSASDHALTLNECNPVWMRPPVSPYTASMMEGRHVDLDLIRDQYRQLRARFPAVLVEGVGGWRVPLRRDYFVSDLAVDMGQPVLVVAVNELGALNHTLLTVEAVRQTGLSCAGIIFNHRTGEQDAAIFTNRAVLEELTDVPILLEISPGQTEIPAAGLQKIRAAAK